MSSWWIHAYYDHAYAKCNRIIIKILLNVHMYREEMCKFCTMNCVNNVSHILFVCPCNENIRKELWYQVKIIVSRNLFADIEKMNTVYRTVFILNACNVRYGHEWKETLERKCHL